MTGNNEAAKKVFFVQLLFEGEISSLHSTDVKISCVLKSHFKFNF